jgi:OTU domain-containing protein 5
MAMRKKGFEIRKTRPDGACFFRAVAAQLFGDEDMHEEVRRHVCDYMVKNGEHFGQYVTEDFARYVQRKRRPDCHANYLELQAVSELFNRPIEVYQYDITPINVFHGQYQTENDPIRVSYHRKRHYNAVIDPYKATVGVGLGLPGLQPGVCYT